MNVLSKGVPKVMGLAEALKEWLDHRREVLVRRSKHPPAEIDHRLEVLGGLLVAYLNLDKVIKIIRNEDEPKPVLIKTFKLTDVQADAILNMRLRNLRKLEEMEIKHGGQGAARGEEPLEKLLRSERSSGRRSPNRSRRCARSSARRRRSASAAPNSPRRPSTTRRRLKRRWWCASRSPWSCRRKGGSARCADIDERHLGLAFKADDGLKFAFSGGDHIEDSGVRHQRALLHARCLQAAGRARPRRAGAAIHRSGAGCELVTAFRYQSGRKFLVASKQGRGFVVAEDECLANTRKGKQVLNVKPPDTARAIATVEGELVAVIGENRKM